MMFFIGYAMKTVTSETFITLTRVEESTRVEYERTTGEGKIVTRLMVMIKTLDAGRLGFITHNVGYKFGQRAKTLQCLLLENDKPEKVVKVERVIFNDLKLQGRLIAFSNTSNTESLKVIDHKMITLLKEVTSIVERDLQRPYK